MFLIEAGKVKRPEKVKVKYIDETGEEKVIEGTGLLAKALCHEIVILTAYCL